MNTKGTENRMRLTTLCKKSIAIALCFVMLTLVGCTGRTDNNPKPSEKIGQQVDNTSVPDGISPKDYNALRSFLEWEDENGGKNGKMLNINYSPDDISTWTGVVFEEGFIKSIDFSMKGLAGSFDLSGLDKLECINVSNNMLTSICLDGLDSLKTLIVHGNMLTSLTVNAKSLEKLDFSSNDYLTSVELTVPTDGFDSTEQAKLLNIVAVLDNGFRIELSCDTQETEPKGYIGFRFIEDEGIKHYFAVAMPFDGAEAFSGWLDLNGDYPSKDTDFCLDDFVNNPDGEQFLWLKAVFD